MTLTSSADVPVTVDWVDITVGRPQFANADIAIQNKVFGGTTYLVLGGANQPSEAVTGYMMGHREVWKVKSDHIWVRSEVLHDGKLAVGIVT
jgi:hypothetical protein